MKKLSILLLLICLLLTGCCQESPLPEAPPTETAAEPVPQAIFSVPAVTVEETAPPETIPTETVPLPPAQAIMDGFSLRHGNSDYVSPLMDALLSTRVSLVDVPLEITSSQPIGGVYLIWYQPPDCYTLTWPGGSLTQEQAFLHTYIPLPEATTQLTIQGGGDLGQIQLYTPGSVPDGVQAWQPPLEQADILAFPTHSDDDALFFGALLSRCAMDEGLTVQTAFLIDHADIIRSHERLNGLWEMGVRNYPVIAPFTDFYTLNLQTALAYHQRMEEDILGWQVEQIRKFQPLVILGHDLQGEYGHGQHQVNAYYLTQAVELAAQADAYPLSAQAYGTWDTPKLYLHMYEENQLLLDVDTPLVSDSQGRTPFEVAAAAYRCHRTQQGTGFYVCRDQGWRRSDCRLWGLYRSLVGNQEALMAGIQADQWR